MFARRPTSDTPRRGIVLVLILGMLALLALIGVTFAGIASQSMTSSRKFAQSLLVPEAERMFDFGLSQLINDTTDPMSALFGHGILRDMYGDDGGANGFIPRFTLIGTGLTNIYDTDIPAYPAAHGVALVGTSDNYGKSLIGWAVILPGNGILASQTLQVVGSSVVNGTARLACTAPDTSGVLPLMPPPVNTSQSLICSLDGRFLRAFN